VLHKYVLCVPAVLRPGNRDKVLLVEGGGGETEREGREGEASATNFQNKIAAQGYIPQH
jgi:hypothetical protein